MWYFMFCQTGLFVRRFLEHECRQFISIYWAQPFESDIFAVGCLFLESMILKRWDCSSLFEGRLRRKKVKRAASTWGKSRESRGQQVSENIFTQKWCGMFVAGNMASHWIAPQILPAMRGSYTNLPLIPFNCPTRIDYFLLFLQKSRNTKRS